MAVNLQGKFQDFSLSRARDVERGDAEETAAMRQNKELSDIHDACEQFLDLIDTRELAS